MSSIFRDQVSKDLVQVREDGLDKRESLRPSPQSARLDVVGMQHTCTVINQHANNNIHTLEDTLKDARAEGARRLSINYC